MEFKMCSISFTYLHFCLLFQMSCKTQNENKKPEFVNMYLHICLYSKVYSTTATYISEWLFFISKTLMVCFSVTIHLDFLFFISQTSKCLYLDSHWKLKNVSKYISLKDECLFIETDYDYYNFLSLRPTFYSLSTESFKSTKNEIIIFWLVELS